MDWIPWSPLQLDGKCLRLLTAKTFHLRLHDHIWFLLNMCEARLSGKRERKRSGRVALVEAWWIALRLRTRYSLTAPLSTQLYKRQQLYRHETQQEILIEGKGEVEEGEVKRVWPPAKNTLSRAIIHVASKMAQPRLCVVKKKEPSIHVLLHTGTKLDDRFLLQRRRQARWERKQRGRWRRCIRWW